jgi:hypothetical protein
MADSARLDELRRHFEENPRRYFAPLASALRRSGDARAAAALARTQLASYPGHLTGHVVLGQALLDVGDVAGAREAFTRAAALDEGNVVALQQLLALARDAGDRAATRHWTDRLVEADPELAAELTAAPPDAFEPLDLEQLSDGVGDAPFVATDLDPRLAVGPAAGAAGLAVGAADVPVGSDAAEQWARSDDDPAREAPDASAATAAGAASAAHPADPSGAPAPLADRAGPAGVADAPAPGASQAGADAPTDPTGPVDASLAARWSAEDVTGVDDEPSQATAPAADPVDVSGPGARAAGVGAGDEADVGADPHAGGAADAVDGAPATALAPGRRRPGSPATRRPRHGRRRRPRSNRRPPGRRPRSRWPPQCRVRVGTRCFRPRIPGAASRRPSSPPRRRRTTRPRPCASTTRTSSPARPRR